MSPIFRAGISIPKYKFHSMNHLSTKLHLSTSISQSKSNSNSSLSIMTLLKQIVLPPRPTPLANRPSALRSAYSRLGRALSSSLESSYKARSRRSGIAPTVSDTRPVASNANTATPPHRTRRATLVSRSSSSPRRRSSASSSQTRAPSSQTPRRGEKKKKQRRGPNTQHDVINGATLPEAIDRSVTIDNRSSLRSACSHHRPTTDFLG